MSTRTHWLRPIDKRITACGRNAFQSDIFEGSAAEYLGVSNFCVKCERSAQKEQQPRPRSCKHCGSQAINPGFRDRPPGVDLDLCDVCFWRTMAQAAPQWPEPRSIEEAPQNAVLGWCPRQEEWITCYPWHKDYWNGIDGERHEITHFLPLPPQPEVRK